MKKTKYINVEWHLNLSNIIQIYVFCVRIHLHIKQNPPGQTLSTLGTRVFN